MKKLLTLLLITLLVATLAFATACGGSNETSATSSDSTADSTAPNSTTTPDSTTPPTTTTEATVTTPNPVLVTAYDEPEKFVTLPDFAEITVSKAPIQEEVDKYLENLLSSMGRDDFRETESGTVAILGDSLNIHYTGRAKDPSVTLSAETLKGMSNASDQAGYDLVLGSGSFIPGFEEQLVGAKAGDKVSVDVTFPKNYSPELSEVAVIFEVTVNKVSRCTVSERNSVFLSVLYEIKDNTASDKLSAFLEMHEATVDLTDSASLLDDIFPQSAFKDKLLGLNLFGTTSFDIVMPLEAAEEFGYNAPITLNAKITVEQIVYYPTEITDEDINAFTGGDYTTAQSFIDYVFNHYKSSAAYEAVIKAATFGEIPKEVYDVIYKNYYDTSIYNQVGDIEGLDEEELAATLTETVINTAKKFAEENTKSEWEDRMLVAYLSKKLNFTLTEDKYQELLKDLYDYYVEYYYMNLIYSGITDITSFEAFFGPENLRFQFTVDEVIPQLGERITLVD